MKTPEFNIIFLDIDGVLNSDNFRFSEFSRTGKPISSSNFIDPAAVDRLWNLLRKHDDLKLVISSSWRGLSFWDTIKTIQNTRTLKFLSQFVVGITPRDNRTRGEQIKSFIHWASFWSPNMPRVVNLMPDNFKIKNYVILDDDSDMLPEQMDHFVKTTWEKGLLDEHIQKIENILYNK